MALNWLMIVILSSIALPEQYRCQSSSGQKRYGSSTVGVGSATNYRPSWSNGAPLAVPLRNFQAPAPVSFHYYSRLLADPYYGTAADYYYAPADSYSYPSSYDSDYYPNVLYYLLPNQASYGQHLPAAMSYDLGEDVYAQDRENGPKNWWHDDANEPDLSGDDYYQINGYYMEPMAADGYDETSRTTTTTSRPSVGNNPYKQRRFGGIDGFGRLQENERIFGMRRPNENDRRKGERPRVYGVPVRTKYNQDEDVKELESLRSSEQQQTRHHFLQQQLAPKAEPLQSSIPSSAHGVAHKQQPKVAGPAVNYLGPELADWINGNIRKKKSSSSSNLISGTEKSRGSLKAVFENAASASEGDNYFRMFPDNAIDEPEVGNDLRYSADRSSSVFDTIKKLLAMEDKVNQQQLEEQAQIKFENQNDISTNEIAGSRSGENMKKTDNRKRSLQLTDELQQTVNKFDLKTDSSLNNESLPKELENLRTSNGSDNH